MTTKTTTGEEPETVFVTTRSGHTSNPRVVHTRPGCKLLARAKKTLEKPIAVYPPNHRRWCRHCGPHGGDE